MCKPNFKKNGCWRYAVLMDEMVNDYLKAMNISFKEIPMYKKTQWRLLNNLPLNKKQKELEDVCRHNLQTNQFSTFLNMKNNNVEGLLKNN